MKLHFEPNLDYQHAAIESVCDLFKGQEICRSVFTVTRDTNDAQQRMGFAENDIGSDGAQRVQIVPSRFKSRRSKYINKFQQRFQMDCRNLTSAVRSLPGMALKASRAFSPSPPCQRMASTKVRARPS